MIIRRPEHLHGLRNRVIARAKVAYAELNNLGEDRMEALFRLRYEQLGFRPLRDGRLTIAEQMNQSFHVFAAFAAAEIIFTQFPNCGPLTLSPATAGGHDIKADGTNFVAAEVFTTANPEFLKGKLWEDAKKVNDASKNGVSYCKRFVFFYYSKEADRDLLKSVGCKFPEVKIRSLNWDEMMGH